MRKAGSRFEQLGSARLRPLDVAVVVVVAPCVAIVSVATVVVGEQHVGAG